MLKFRLSYHWLPVETSRWVRSYPIEDRKCTLCYKNDIGGELYYLFVCDHFTTDRKSFFKLFFYKSPTIIKFEELFASVNTKNVVKLSSFEEIIMSKFSSET